MLEEKKTGSDTPKLKENEWKDVKCRQMFLSGETDVAMFKEAAFVLGNTHLFMLVQSGGSGSVWSS